MQRHYFIEHYLITKQLFIIEDFLLVLGVYNYLSTIFFLIIRQQRRRANFLFVLKRGEKRDTKSFGREIIVERLDGKVIRLTVV